MWESFVRLYQKTKTSDFVRKVAETFVTRILSIGVGLIISVIVARILGPEGRGLYAVAVTIGAMGVQFGNLGLHASNTYYVARDRSLLPGLVGNTIVVSFAFGSLGIALTWITFFFWPNLAPVHDALLILSLIYVPFGLAYLLLQNLLLGLQEVSSYNKIELATKILGVSLLGTIVFLTEVTVEKVFLAGLVTLIISFVWAFWQLKFYLVMAPAPSLALFRETIYYGLKAYLAAFFTFLVIRVDLLMVKYILGAEQTGYYSIAVNMADMVYMLPVITGTILFPKLAAITSQSEKWVLTRRVALFLALLILILASGVALLAEPVIELLFGKVFVPAVPAFRWLMPGIFVLSVNTIFMNFFASIGMPLITVYSPMIALVINIMLNMKLIPLYGIVGASFSSVVAYSMMMILSLIFIYKERVNRSA
jgi:O-antigen/teichoic acid export membrane protein